MDHPYPIGTRVEKYGQELPGTVQDSVVSTFHGQTTPVKINYDIRWDDDVVTAETSVTITLHE